MSARLTPNVLLSAVIAFSLALAAIMVGLAMEQRWLGLTLVLQPERQRVWIERVDGQGPSHEIHADVVLLALTGANGSRIELEPADLMEEPDILPSYAALDAFLERQTRLSEILESRPVTLETEFLSEARGHDVWPAARRPVTSLPSAFWMQIGVGLAGFWIGGWIWALRRREWATRCLMIAGSGLMISAFSAAVYSTRELALPGNLFWLLGAFNSVGACIFGVGMIGLFLIYPRRLVSSRWLMLPAVVLGLWKVLDLTELLEGPGTGRHLPVAAAMLAIVILILIQFRATRGDPRARAALTWLGLAVIVGAGAFVTTIIAPTLLGLKAAFTQSEAFLFFLLVYLGVALGVARFRLFQLDEWAFRILFYVIGVMLLLVIDAVLILTIVDERAPAFALSLLIVALAWLPMRDTLARIFLRRREPGRENLFRKVMDVALTPPGRDQHARWQTLLEESFQPLSVERTETAESLAIVEDGLAMLVPGPRDLPGHRLELASGGRKLFSLRDLELASELCAMLTNALESRAAYEKGVAEERQRIARDIHDNIGVQLMGALHSKDYERKDLMIRETLTDLRDIVNNASNPDLSFEEMLADLRSQIAEHLFAAGVKMEWHAQRLESTLLPLAAAHTLRSVIREAVQNALKHSGAGAIRIDVDVDEGMVVVMVTDDGRGFDPGSVRVGNGLANMRARVTGLGGRFNVTGEAGGTRVEARFPIGSTGENR